MDASEFLKLPYTKEKGVFNIVISGEQLLELNKRFKDTQELRKKIKGFAIKRETASKTDKSIYGSRLYAEGGDDMKNIILELLEE